MDGVLATTAGFEPGIEQHRPGRLAQPLQVPLLRFL
jgi:hypothetical protein